VEIHGDNVFPWSSHVNIGNNLRYLLVVFSSGMGGLMAIKELNEFMAELAGLERKTTNGALVYYEHPKTGDTYLENHVERSQYDQWTPITDMNQASLICLPEIIKLGWIPNLSRVEKEWCFSLTKLEKRITFFGSDIPSTMCKGMEVAWSKK